MKELMKNAMFRFDLPSSLQSFRCTLSVVLTWFLRPTAVMV